tara:strand:- start:1121 stop:1822 length:702 start_codon:yes stop_codon:yes gene_type:complete
MLYIDDRENERLQHKLIAALGDAKYSTKGKASVKRLSVGDYALGDWLIEAKEINDLYKSILGVGRNGRTIVNQLVDLCQSTDTPILAVYGTQLKPYFRKRAGPKIVAAEKAKMRRVIKSFKMTLYVRFPNIRLIELSTMDDFVEWLTVSHTRKEIEKSISPHKKNKTINSDSRIAALSGISGITETMAKEILDEFGSLTELLRKRTNQKRLMKVRGIGRGIAKRLLDLREDWK